MELNDVPEKNNEEAGVINPSEDKQIDSNNPQDPLISIKDQPDNDQIKPLQQIIEPDKNDPSKDALIPVGLEEQINPDEEKEDENNSDNEIDVSTMETNNEQLAKLLSNVSQNLGMEMESKEKEVKEQSLIDKFEYIPEEEEIGKNIIIQNENEVKNISLSLLIRNVLSKPNGNYQNIENEDFIRNFSYQKSALFTKDAYIDFIQYFFDNNILQTGIILVNQYLYDYYNSEIKTDKIIAERLISFYNKIVSENGNNEDTEIEFLSSNNKVPVSKILSVLKEKDKVKAYLKLEELNGINMNTYKDEVFDTDIPEKITNKFDIINYDSLEIAKQISLYTQYLFKNIETKELLNASWTKKYKLLTSPNIVKLIERFNSITYFICEEILSYDHKNQRGKVINKFIEIAAHLRGLNDYNDCFNIISAFNNLSIKRLKKTWSTVSKSDLEILKEFSDLCSFEHNMELLRGEYEKFKRDNEEMDHCCIPYLGFFLKDLALINEGPKYFMDNETNKFLINTDKINKVGKIIREIKYYQKGNYSFKPLFYMFYLSEPKPLSEENLINISEKLEPKFIIYRTRSDNRRKSNTEIYYNGEEKKHSYLGEGIKSMIKEKAEKKSKILSLEERILKIKTGLSD